MKKYFSKKGFTLIELLAVIVILAIIVIIAILAIMGMMDNANKEAAKSNAIEYIDSVEKQIEINMEDSSKANILDGEYTVEVLKNSYSLSVKGDAPIAGNLIIEKGKVQSYELCFSSFGYKIIKEDGNNEKVKKGKCSIEKGLVGKPIGDKAQNLLDNNAAYGNYTYMGGTYLKGNQSSNYVWYNGFMWRIMGKNADGTVRLITDENVTNIPWGTYYAGDWNATGYIKDWLTNLFLTNLNQNKKSIIVTGEYYCNEPTTSDTERTICASPIRSNIGLISVDEYNLSRVKGENIQNYLNIEQQSWTMTLYDTSRAWLTDLYDSVRNYYVTSLFGVRPVINVKTDATITEGNGSAISPFILGQETTSVVNKTMNEQVSSGEYVSLNSKIYRVVAKEEQGIKLILDGYYEIYHAFLSAVGPDYPQYGSSNIFAGSKIDTLLNGTILAWLDSDKIIDASWNQGTAYTCGNPYTTSLTDSDESIMRKVGLIRIGEMLSGQSSTILTKNYTSEPNSIETAHYWTMTPCAQTSMLYPNEVNAPYPASSAVWSISAYGDAGGNYVQNPDAVRPVIYVASDATISKGNGTPSSPYIIE